MPSSQSEAETKVEEKLREAYNALCNTRKEEVDKLLYFAEVCKEAHEVGISDEKIRQLIDEGFSRARIQQLRCGKVVKGQ